MLSGLGLVLIAATLLFRVQLTSALMAMGIIKGLVALGLGAAFVPVGETLLENDALRPLCATVLNLPVVAWMDLDSLGITGGALVGLAIGLVAFWPVRQTVASYRRFLHDRVTRNRFFQTVTNFWFIKGLRFIFIGNEAMS